MDYDDEFVEFKHQASRKRVDKDSQYKDNSKRRLLNILKKKFDTTIIGSLAAFEERFGELCGLLVATLGGPARLQIRWGGMVLRNR